MIRFFINSLRQNKLSAAPADPEFIRTDVYCKDPALKYRFTIAGCDDIYFLQNRKFNLMTTESALFCSATGGLITICVSDEQTEIFIESTAFKSFTILFAYLMERTYGIAIEVKISREGPITVSKITNNNVNSHSYFPSKYYHEAVCVFGIKKYNSHEVFNALIDIDEYPQDIAHNSIVDRFGDAPNLFIRCTRCLVYSFNGHHHTAPCAPINTISMRRHNILAKMCSPMFNMRTKSDKNQLFFLDHTGRFNQMKNYSKLLSASTDGYFSFNSSEQFNWLNYSTSQFHRFSVIVAIYMNGFWRLRLHAKTTNKHGLLLFKMQKTLTKIENRFVLPSGYALDNVLLVGIKPTNINALKIDFKVYANQIGTITKQPFDGIYRYAQYNEEFDCFDFDDGISHEVFFSKNIYTKPPVPLSTLHEQQLDLDLI